MPQRKITIAILAGTLLVLLLIGGMLMQSAPRAPEVQTTGAPDIGGPYTLVTHQGQNVSEASFLGAPQLIFFGFTYCPDVCPLTLEVIGAVLDELGEDGKNLQPLFVSVDPERDTPDDAILFSRPI